MQTPREVLLSFMKAMNEWERKCYNRESASYDVDDEENDFDYAASKNIGVDDYMEIFNKHCSANSIPRSYTFQDPPEYDPESVTFIDEKEIDQKRFEIHTRMSNMAKNEDLYIIILEGSEWRILERKWLNKHKNEFIKSYL